MPLKILIVSDHYPPFIGGAHRQSQLLARELCKRGHTVKVATVWHGGFAEKTEEENITVFRLKQMRTAFFVDDHDRQQRHQPPFPDPVTILGLRKVISEFNPDVIHSYGWISYSCAVALLGKKIPLMISARDYGYTCATQTLIYQNATVCSGPAFSKCLTCASNLYGSATGWVAVAGVALGRNLLKHKINGLHSISAFVQQVMDQDFWDAKKTKSKSDAGKVLETVIPSFQEDEDPKRNGIAPDIEHYVSQLPEKPFILFVGAFRRVKGVHLLLDAYQQLNSPPPMVLIGTFEFDTPSSFPSGVVVLKSFPHHAVMAAWERSLFGVLPSLWPEPLGSVVYEAMSKGKAVIGTTPGGHADMIVDNKTGFLVPAGDLNALIASMQKLIDDPELCQRLGQAGLERSRMFRAKVAVPQFEEFYLRLIKESGNPLSFQS